LVINKKVEKMKLYVNQNYETSPLELNTINCKPNTKPVEASQLITPIFSSFSRNAITFHKRIDKNYGLFIFFH
jgi:hypothetical protein